MDFKKLGLFKILKQIGKVNYKLRPFNKFQLYLVFYILLLKPIKEDILLVINKEI